MIDKGIQELAHQAGNHRVELTVEAFKKAVVDNLYYVRGQGALTASKNDIYSALAYTVRDYLIDRFRKTIDTYSHQKNVKFVYYLSAEYLPGKQITQNLLYTGTTELAKLALAELGFDLDELIEIEAEPALGNGGLGRLAACYMDSMATLNIPSIAYGINYEFGIFKQSFQNGFQMETPDEWLYYGNPWEFPQSDNRVEVGFGGQTTLVTGTDGKIHVHWKPEKTVLGEPTHMLVPGYGTSNMNVLRLWKAKASKEFDFQLFDIGDYARAAEQKISSENLSKVLYPNDHSPQGRELRLKQEYFFVSCSIHDILRRFFAFQDNLENLPDYAVIQLNDTHPVLAIPELMRILMDEHGMEWDAAWKITRNMFAYTCHTLLPEALEKWPVSLFEYLLPRHLEIIYDINARFLDEVKSRYPNDLDRIIRMSLIEENPERMVRMANLATVGSFSVNGVAELHTSLLQSLVLKDFSIMMPEKFNNKTNGVSPRRFLRISNPRLSGLITAAVGDGWEANLNQLKELEQYASDAAFRQSWRVIKGQNKVELSEIILKQTGVRVTPDSMFDIMVKRLHEYKRQTLKALHIITLYNRIKNNPDLQITPRTFIFGAKAAPGYHMAKMIIKFINSIAEVVNQDLDIGDRMKVVFLPNFNVTLAEKIYPAANLSEQISMAGKEASGTGNMKFALNGALTVGTLDGANIEILERVGEGNFFTFGLSVDEVFDLKSRGYKPYVYYENQPELKLAIDQISNGVFSGGDKNLFKPLVDTFLYQDLFLNLADYASYVHCQDQVDKAFVDVEEWTKKSILNSARMGFFSSDRAVRQYNDEIWKVKPLPPG